MATSANIGSFLFKIGTGASPDVPTLIEEVFSVSPVGKTNSLEDVTNFDSPTGTREFIAGLAEGDEISVEANYVPAAAGQVLAMTAVDNGVTRSFSLSYTGISPAKTWTGNVVCLRHGIAPNPTGRNTVQFTFKITGDVTRA